MANTIYIDANRTNSVNSEENMNEWTYKLNSELLLPKGTEVQIQNTFINKKGITGGSIEILEDIEEEMNMVYYVSEQGHYTTTPNQGNITDQTGWCRTTLGVSLEGFKKNFENTNGEISEQGFTEIFMPIGSLTVEDLVRTVGFNNCFDNLGGSSQPLIRCKYSKVDDGGALKYVLSPFIKTFVLFIPKGTYGVGGMGQLIDDQLNGNIFTKIVNGKRVFVKKSEIQENLDDNGLDFDGNIFNNPLLDRVDVMNRGKTFEKYQTGAVVAGLAPHRDCFEAGSINTTDVFIPMDKFNEMVSDFKIKPVLSNSPYMSEYDYLETAVSPAAHGNTGKGTKLMPVYYFQESGADGNPVFNGNGADVVDTTQKDSNFLTYNCFSSAPDSDTFFNRTISRFIGTSNFKFSYDSVNNGYSIAGLHEQVKAPSHNRTGISVAQSGNTIIGVKKVNRNISVNLGSARDKIKGCFDAPETRTSGVMIFNWAYSTAVKESDIDLSFMADDGTIDNTCPLTWSSSTQPVNSKKLLYHFRDFFSTEEKARIAWKKTIWGRLGFSYDDIANYDSYREYTIWDKTQKVREFGFTTDALLDNTIMPTISSEYSNWNSHLGGDGLDNNVPTFKGVQTYGLFGSNTPQSLLPMGNPNGSGAYENFTNSLYSGSAYYPITTSNVNGYTASLLPTLSTQSYFIITADICDNFKDNVKKGDVLPILGIVPKSNLSNQDFIASENQIVQVIRDAKVINKIKIKILNPDLTAPDLGEFSSVILKITLPNLTPTPLLPPKVQNQLAKQSITF